MFIKQHIYDYHKYFHVDCFVEYFNIIIWHIIYEYAPCSSIAANDFKICIDELKREIEQTKLEKGQSIKKVETWGRKLKYPGP